MRSTEALGCWLHERWRTECALSPALSRLTGITWQGLCNRHERLLPGSDARSRVCDWVDSSWLTVARVFPRTGARLLAHCLREWPIRFASAEPIQGSAEPDVSVVLPVSGAARLAQFRAVLSCLAAQESVRSEIVVAEEGVTSLLRDSLPSGIRYVFVERRPDESYCKSRMVNAGVAAARGRHVVIHDADILVPTRYLAEAVRCLDAEWEAVRPIRFLFSLDEHSSAEVQGTGRLDAIRRVGEVMQNFPGGSLAMRRSTYWQIGGMDERFRDWGGEDNEFLDRLQTRRLLAGAYAPGIHLWHAAAPKKSSGDRNQSLTTELRQRPPQERIASLKARRRESPAGVTALP